MDHESPKLVVINNVYMLCQKWYLKAKTSVPDFYKNPFTKYRHLSTTTTTTNTTTTRGE